MLTPRTWDCPTFDCFSLSGSYYCLLYKVLETGDFWEGGWNSYCCRLQPEQKEWGEEEMLKYAKCYAHSAWLWWGSEAPSERPQQKEQLVTVVTLLQRTILQERCQTLGETFNYPSSFMIQHRAKRRLPIEEVRIEIWWDFMRPFHPCTEVVTFPNHLTHMCSLFVVVKTNSWKRNTNNGRRRKKEREVEDMRSKRRRLANSWERTASYSPNLGSAIFFLCTRCMTSSQIIFSMHSYNSNLPDPISVFVQTRLQDVGNILTPHPKIVLLPLREA